MKKILVLTALLFFSALCFGQQNFLQQSQTFVATTTATVQPTLPLGSNFPGHTISVVTSGTAVGTVQLQQCTTALIGSCSNLTGSTSVNVATCTLANPCTQTIEGQTPAFGAFTITLGTCTACAVQVTYTAFTYPFILNTNDGFYWVPLEACGLNLTVGALAAASTTGQLPGITRPAAGNSVLQISTTAAANTTQLDCDISPPSRTTAGKGITVTGAQVFYGYQTTALTTITGPVFNTVTYSATGGAAAGTVGAAGGSITVTPGTSHSTPGAVTTTGQCYSENASFATPVTINNSLVRLTLEEQFAQSAAAATVLQICGVAVFYQNTPL